MSDKENNQPYWYAGLLNDNDNELTLFDHQHYNSEGDDCTLKRPRLDHIHDVDPVQTVPCVFNFEWNVSRREAMFVLTNSQDSKTYMNSFTSQT